MKILIIGFAKIKYMPYLNFYLDSIDGEQNEVHVAYWNRDEKEEDLNRFQSITFHEFVRYQEDDVPIRSKILSFLAFRKWAKKVLKTLSPDRIICLHTFPAFLLADKLTKKYKGKFIFDYRDHTYEGISLFKKIIGNVVKASLATFVSSDAFRQFLPAECKHKIHTSHNLLKDSLLHRHKNKIADQKIRISYWGFIRHEDVNRKIIEKISADDRFELHYYGKEQQVALNLKEYASSLSARNIFFHGEYKPEDRYEFVKNTDLIHNIFCDDNMMLAMSNRFYDGLLFYLPQLCMKGSFMGEQASDRQIGLECDPHNDDFLDQIYHYVKNLDQSRFQQNCDTELERILSEYDNGILVIRQATCR